MLLAPDTPLVAEVVDADAAARARTAHRRLSVCLTQILTSSSAWLLERKYPDEYAQTTRRAEAEGEDVPQITLGVELKVARSSDGDD